MRVSLSLLFIIALDFFNQIVERLCLTILSAPFNLYVQGIGNARVHTERRIHMLSPDAMAFMEHLAELYKTTGNNSFDFIEYMSVPNHSAALEELMAKGYVSWKDDLQNILGTITINLDVLKKR